VGAIVALILFIDQAIKVYIKTHFSPGDDPVSVFGNWFVLEYIENQGMAFGTTFGNKLWHKLALSIFRIFAIIGICYYWYKQAQDGAKREFLVAIGLILAGATGNLIDSMFYDFIFPYDPCMPFNHLEGSGLVTDCGFFGKLETRHTGFLLGNVVDMFKFQAFWPEWLPWLGGREVFPAIWNLADAAISIGVVMIFIRQRAYFPNKKKGRKKKHQPAPSSEIDPGDTSVV
jgi:signal peptidase II